MDAVIQEFYKLGIRAMSKRMLIYSNVFDVPSGQNLTYQRVL